VTPIDATRVGGPPPAVKRLVPVMGS